MTIGRKFKHKEPDKIIEKPKEDSNFNNPDADGKYSKEPRQKSNIGIYRCCMESGHTCNPTHIKDELKGLTRFWCIECGWELTLTQSDAYMNSQRGENKY